MPLSNCVFMSMFFCSFPLKRDYNEFFENAIVFYYACMRSTSLNMLSENWGRLPHFDKNGTDLGELQLPHSYKPLIYDVDMYK